MLVEAGIKPGDVRDFTRGELGAVFAYLRDREGGD